MSPKPDWLDESQKPGDWVDREFVPGAEPAPEKKAPANKVEERRTVQPVEYRHFLREVRTRGRLGLEGRAATFNEPTQLRKFVFEEINKRCFDRALAEKQDVRYLVSHDPDQLLARVSNGSLRLSTDSRGLNASIDLLDTRAAIDHHANVKSGLLNAMSFGFKPAPNGDKWSEERAADGTYFAKRELLDVELLEISSVCFPQYSGTLLSARAANVPAELRAHVRVLNQQRGFAESDETDEDAAEDEWDLFGPEYKEDLSDSHVEGDCADGDCSCQNIWCMPGRRSLQLDVEKRGMPVLTKRVGGKNLPASSFSRVDDPDRTETWRGAKVNVGTEADAAKRRRDLLNQFIS